ncbi:MAG: hypothetical protein JKY31_05035 [Rhodobacteraceae bacterium]|nr:hypothetical protein [Paracoccaceae bacterium]
MKHFITALPLTLLLSSCGMFGNLFGTNTPPASGESSIPAWDGAHILCSENVSFAQSSTDELPEFDDDERLGFCSRSMKYLELHRQYGDQTPYFGIAAATTGSLAATYARLVRRAYSAPTWAFMQELNVSLDRNVDAAAAQLAAGGHGNVGFTNRMIRQEQNAVQEALDTLQQSDPDAFATVIKELGSTLNPTNPMLLAAINRNPFFAAYEASLAVIRTEVGGPVDYSNPAHRLKISTALNRLITNIAPYPNAQN